MAPGRTEDLPGRGRRIGGWLAALVLAALVAFAGGWSAATLLRPPVLPEAEVTASYVTAELGTVQRSQTTLATARWDRVTSYPNALEGVVTGRTLTGTGTVKAGDLLYEVNLIPVVVGEGDTPAFRELARGVNGRDVAGWQQLLRALGHRKEKADGRFDYLTDRQTRAWQKATGQPVTGRVPLGQVVFVAELPARGYLGADLAVGARVGAGPSAPTGEDAAAPRTGLVILTGTPTFRMALTRNQAAMAVAGTPVELRHDGQTWAAEVDGVAAPAEDGSVTVTLRGVDGKPVCADACGAILPEGLSGIDTSIEFVPQTDGVVIPASALRLAADGRPSVVGPDGEVIPITIVAAADGFCVVEGIRAGQRLQVAVEPK